MGRSIILKASLPTFVILYASLAYHILLKLHDCSQANIATNFNESSLLVTAHPDDETMFFGPTILNFVEAKKSMTVLCLTNGDGDGLGSAREKELIRVLQSLGANIKLNLIRDERLEDRRDVVWELDIIEAYITEQLKLDRNIKTIITFDSHGVSGHANHVSIFKAIRRMHMKLNYLGIKVFHLDSANIFRKYTSFLDSIVIYVFDCFSYNDQDIILALDFGKHLTLRRILELHESQIVWFRKLYMIFSSYMFINVLSQCPYPIDNLNEIK